MAIHDAGMFTVKEINRLKILQDVIERNLAHVGQAQYHTTCLLKRYRQSGPLGTNNQSSWRNRRRGNPAIISCLIALPGTYSYYPRSLC